mgnify:CR=1 FL=1
MIIENIFLGLQKMSKVDCEDEKKEFDILLKGFRTTQKNPAYNYVSMGASRNGSYLISVNNGNEEY